TGVPLPDAQLNVAYPGSTLGAIGGSGAPYTIAHESGALPPGLTFNAGTRALGVSQTPTALGTYVIGMRVTDSLGHTRVEPLPLRVSPLDITTLVLPQPTLNSPYSVTLAATGVGAVTWSVYV